MQLSFDLGARLILMGIGAIPVEATDPAYQRMLAAVTELAQFGDRIGCRIALDVGLEPVEQLLGFISKLDTGSLGLSLDPATLLMDKQPIEATVLAAKSHIVHTYARDAIPRRIDRPAREVAVGHGDIDWLSWLGTLQACNYSGAYTIKQSPGANPQAEISAAVQFLKKLGVR